MNHTFFAIPALNSDAAATELNTFCAKHRIGNIDKHFVADGANSYWAVCVSWTAGDSRVNTQGNMKKKGRIDYKEILNEADFAIYARLRDLRKAIAEQEGTPPYNVFTNEQLATIVQHGVDSKTCLLAIDGIGQRRVEKYGDKFLQLLSNLRAYESTVEADKVTP